MIDSPSFLIASLDGKLIMASQLQDSAVPPSFHQLPTSQIQTPDPKGKETEVIVYTKKQFEEHAVLIQYIWDMRSVPGFDRVAALITSEDLSRATGITALMSRTRNEYHRVSVLDQYPPEIPTTAWLDPALVESFK